MSETYAETRWTPWRGAGLPAALAVLAVLAGLTAGRADPLFTLALSGTLGASALAACALHPRAGLWILLASTVFLPVLPVTETRGINVVDLVILPTLLGAWFWYRGDRPLGAADPVHRARTRLVLAAFLFYGVAVFSLVLLAARGHPDRAFDSLLILGRSFEGAIFFYLVLRLLRRAGDAERARNAILLGFALSFVVNAVGIVGFDVLRAGIVWIPMRGQWTITDPNEAAMGVVLVWALVLALPLGRGSTVAALGLSFAFLVATQSRSGLLAWLAFVLVYGFQTRSWWAWTLPVGAGLAVPFLPGEIVGRLSRSLVLERGSFEAFSALVRFYTWQASWRVFLDHPLFGVGYLGYRFVSSDYNPLGVVLVTAENQVLEIASGMGLLGLAAFAFVAVAAVRAARAVVRRTAPESPAHRLGKMATPFLIAVAVGGLTGDNLVGMIGVAQVAVFLALVLGMARHARRDVEPVPHAPVR